MTLVAAIVRAWTAVYTWGLPEAERRARRDEIESDLWECRHGDAANRSTVLTVLARLILGVPDDLGWRWERAPAHPWAFGLGVTTALALATLALVSWATSVQPLPVPPAAGWHARFDRPPPPPPPPPPPCPPGTRYTMPPASGVGVVVVACHSR